MKQRNLQAQAQVDTLSWTRGLTWFVFITAALILTGCANPSHQNLLRIDSAAEVYLGQCITPNNTVREAIVRVATADGSDGSGVVIAPNRVLTAAHVLEGSDVLLVYVENAYRQAKLLASDTGLDLALLEVNTENIEPLHIANTQLHVKEPVWAIGFPLALDQRTTQGILREDTGYKLYTSAEINAGNSGGGLLRCENGEYQLAGIVSSYAAYWHEGELVALHDLSISVAANTIEDFMVDSGF